MTAQFPLPGHWLDNASRRNPITILEDELTRECDEPSALN